jgi:hypothetical protein
MDAREERAWAAFNELPLLAYLGACFGAEPNHPRQLAGLIEVAARIWRIRDGAAWDAATATVETRGDPDLTLIDGTGRRAFLSRAQRNVDTIWGDSPPFAEDTVTWIWVTTVLEMVDEVRARKPRPWSPT